MTEEERKEIIHFFETAYECPKHGRITQESVLLSNLPDHEGTWCMKCMLEKLDEVGIPRVVKING